ncbi:MAG: hypothetical protein WBQ41_04460 [Solirubrobacterales bacterium]
MAREIAHALFLVAKGLSYRQSARLAREKANRIIYRHENTWRLFGRAGRRNPNLDGQIVANWVDVFGPVVCDGALPTYWPERIAVDGKGFLNIRSGVSKRAGMGWNLLTAVGYEGNDNTGKIWRLLAVPTHQIPDWVELFEGLRGTPDLIVADMEDGIRTAANQVFPRPGQDAPVFYNCEDHIKRNIKDKLPAQIRNDKEHPLMRSLYWSLSSTADWDSFKKLLHNQLAQTPRPLINQFLSTHEPSIRAQIPTRHRIGPYSIGGPENVQREIEGMLYTRSALMTNAPRANKLLGLLQLGMNGEANEIAWAEKIRSYLERHAGRAPLPQRPHDDPRDHWSLVS